MKSKKLNLGDLKVQSFVTSVDMQLEIAKGGADTTPDLSKLPTQPCNCSAFDGCLTAWNCTNIPAVC